jgi:hypothetical protein
VDAGAEMQASGRRFDDAANANRLGGYGLLNLYTTWHITRDWSLLLRVDNAADKRYDLARNYGTAGRTWFAGAALRSPLTMYRPACIQFHRPRASAPSLSSARCCCRPRQPARFRA